MINNNLKNDYNTCVKDLEKSEKENDILKLENENLTLISIEINNSLAICNNNIQMIKINDTKLSNNLNECIIKVNNLIQNNTSLQKLIISIQEDYTRCDNNLDNYKNLYLDSIGKISQLQSNVNSLTTKNTQLQKNYDYCNNQLKYYNNLQNDYKKLKEENTQITQSLNYCNQDLGQCYADFPIMGYSKLTNEMRSTLNEVIAYSYSHYSDPESRAKYVSDRLNQVYNQALWSCLLVKTSSYYGYYVWYLNDLYLTTTYRSIIWIIYGNYR